MKIPWSESLLIILVVAAVTFFVRLVPFLFIGKGKRWQRLWATWKMRCRLP